MLATGDKKQANKAWTDAAAQEQINQALSAARQK